MPEIAVRALDKAFKRVPVLTGLDLEIEAGECVALLGRNGAGKSTLLRVLATTVGPDGGTVQVAGHDVRRQPDAARACLGVSLADERSWYLRLSGRRNLDYFAALRGLDRSAARRTVDGLLSDLTLSAVADQPASTYSSGTIARLSLARALLGDPRVLLLDEPTRSLDVVAAGQWQGLLAQLRAERSLTIVLTTHDLDEVGRVADRAVVLRHGRIDDELPASATPAALAQAVGA